ncbi:type 4a pilus biogenesis protein PilO [Azoarcus taiwanensis]|uniref:Type 4a pilus biogenesis protein PilO n=1 Tax=Azoarcus taiwanensis TaxID=666964 RepID=A0A972FD58_9RHOO|nr:type 4a pilus biogenesis protein PilO [Azoarcus taiwanensis]NMG03122.1 type 4a pilus biogenesis protein PilO [Azoarcus taiwanensis]
MKSGAKKASKGFDLDRLKRDFQGLDPNDPSLWPGAPRALFLAALLIITVALVWWFDWREQVETLERRQGEELQLREDWRIKKRQAVNLEEYRRQLDETDRQFGALLRQLPNRAEMDSLLSEINQAGLGRGLLFELFKPGSDVVRDFYAEMPIEIRIIGSYHDLGEFASDVARMPRIVTLGNLSMQKQDDNLLRLEARATTYRYLDDEELARQREQTRAAQGGR